MTNPPGPIWSDELTGTAVWINGGLVEITYGDSFDRLLPDEAVQYASALSKAVAQASTWAKRWNPLTRGYNEVAS